jgi:DNA repair photolyase
VTKQSLVERDADIFDILVRLPRAAVGMSISIMDDELSSVIEPWALVTSKRASVLERLSRLRIKTYMIWAPVLVPVPMRQSFVTDSIERLAASGISSLLLDDLNYPSSLSPGFYRRLSRAGHAPAAASHIRSARP